MLGETWRRWWNNCFPPSVRNGEPENRISRCLIPVDATYSVAIRYTHDPELPPQGIETICRDWLKGGHPAKIRSATETAADRARCGEPPGRHERAGQRPAYVKRQPRRTLVGESKRQLAADLSVRGRRCSAGGLPGRSLGGDHDFQSSPSGRGVEGLYRRDERRGGGRASGRYPGTSVPHSERTCRRVGGDVAAAFGGARDFAGVLAQDADAARPVASANREAAENPPVSARGED